ncbi:Fe-S cluster assembly protein SufD [Jiella sp. MQZ9-1]|uniref:Fe-S cluster assembly protein SufD n=1 Tax=Jiella flava TaxID=2816857 RepID=A0A939G0J8_9HYPH|nr:Fe-S cluster assembly protein SufD [Jiella flava]MBO0662834.1 Fe-S cluster assembly protein SufD [Jiella flava]MCD2471405.1 Fe-S cluster assembly protein SufD [Jiella flava]
MSVTELRPRTPAEAALVSLAEAAGTDEDARSAAIEALRREGLPHRRIEAWHYTDLRNLIGRRLGKATGLDAPAGSACDDDVLSPLVAGSTVVDLEAPEDTSAPDGVTITASNDLADWHESPNHLDRPLDTVRLVNAAFGARVAKVAVAANTAVAAPIELRDGIGARPHAAVAATVGTASKAVFVERIEGGGSPAPASRVSHLTIGDGATVLWIIDQAKDSDAAYLGQLNVNIGANATFKLFVLNAGGSLVRQEVHAVTAGEGSEILMRGVNLLQKDQHVDVTTTLRHTFPHTTATETFRNVVTGGHGVFQGMIKVAKDAQKTDAKMACNTLLLSEDGDFSAKPELEIFADDVQCGHGATAGAINADHLFYLMSRGIPAPQAKALLVKAFVDEMVEELEVEAAIADALTGKIDAWLDHSH